MAWIAPSFEDIIPDQSRKDRKGKKVRAASPLHQTKSSKKRCSNLWVDEYPPSSVKDLAVHKKKIEEVQNWLTSSSHKVKERRFLLLTGPPGSAKSTTVRTLAAELRLTLREWTNTDTVKQDYTIADSLGYFCRAEDRERNLNQSDKFSDFLCRSSKYKNICLPSDAISSLILVEEYPQAFFWNPFDFHQILRKYATSNSCTTPIVFVVSESNNNSLLKTLFPSELQEELSITNIAFNPISSTLLVSALSRVLTVTESVNSALFDASSAASKKQFLQIIAERCGGDVRSAVNALQFAMMKDDCGVPSGKARKKDCKGKASVAADLIGCKDSTLVLFRALGKVLYAKREATSCTETKPLPPHLEEQQRNPLLEDPEDVFERSTSDPSTFGLFLHHNSLPFFTKVEDYSTALQYLGDADILDTFWDPSNRVRTYSSSVAVRGMMHSVTSGPKKSQTFRALTRPTWYSSTQTSKERIQRMIHLNKYSSMTNEELSSTYVPLVPKIFVSGETEVDRLVRDIGLFYPAPPVTKATGCSSASQETTPGSLQDEDEDDFFIEEFKD